MDNLTKAWRSFRWWWIDTVTYRAFVPHPESLGDLVWPPVDHQSLGNPQSRSTMEIKAAIEALNFDNVVLIDPPVNALDRLSKALAKATKEGRGTKTLADIEIQFLNADSPSPGVRNTQTYAYIQVPSGASLVSGYATWEPAGTDEIGKELYDCYAVANEINALK